MADVLRHAYDDAIWNAGEHEGGADGVLICGGTLRGDSRYGPGWVFQWHSWPTPNTHITCRENNDWRYLGDPAIR